MTFDQMVTKVIVRMRESGTDAEYSALIGEFVNETKREIEDLHSWLALRSTTTVTTVQGTTQYAVTNLLLRSRILSVYETTTNTWIDKGNTPRLKAEIEEASQGQPHAYYVEGIENSTGKRYVNFAMTPDAVYSYDFTLSVPGVELTTGLIPDIDPNLIILGAHAKALEERGDDGGNSISRALQKYGSSVSRAIQLDMDLTQDEDTWHV